MASDSDDLSNIGVFDTTGLELVQRVLETNICVMEHADTMWVSRTKLEAAYPGKFDADGFCKQPKFLATHSTRVLGSPSTPIVFNYLSSNSDLWRAALINTAHTRDLPPVVRGFDNLGHGLRALRSGHKNLDDETGVEFSIVAGCNYPVTPGHVYVFENPAAVPAQFFEEKWAPISKQKRVGSKKRKTVTISKQTKVARTHRKRRH